MADEAFNLDLEITLQNVALQHNAAFQSFMPTLDRISLAMFSRPV